LLVLASASNFLSSRFSNFYPVFQPLKLEKSFGKNGEKKGGVEGWRQTKIIPPPPETGKIGLGKVLEKELENPPPYPLLSHAVHSPPSYIGRGLTAPSFVGVSEPTTPAGHQSLS
jgi:hypothetical protein